MPSMKNSRISLGMRVWTNLILPIWSRFKTFKTKERYILRTPLVWWTSNNILTSPSKRCSKMSTLLKTFSVKDFSNSLSWQASCSFMTRMSLIPTTPARILNSMIYTILINWLTKKITRNTSRNWSIRTFRWTCTMGLWMTPIKTELANFSPLSSWKTWAPFSKRSSSTPTPFWSLRKL